MSPDQALEPTAELRQEIGPAPRNDGGVPDDAPVHLGDLEAAGVRLPDVGEDLDHVARPGPEGCREPHGQGGDGPREHAAAAEHVVLTGAPVAHALVGDGHALTQARAG